MNSDKNLTNRFIRSWANRPLFRTAIALALLVTLHAILLSINSPGVGLEGWLSAWVNLLREYAGAGIISLGMMFVITCGGADLSSGASAAAISAAAVLFAGSGLFKMIWKLSAGGIPAYAAIIFAGLAFGALLGLITGLLITRGDIPPLIATLGTMMLYRGFTLRVMGGVTAALPAGFEQIALYKILGGAYLPVIYWLVLAAALYILLNKTVFGKFTVAVGSNEKAAWLAGINVGRTKRLVYMLAGIMTAFAAVIQLSASGAPDFASAGGGYATDAIAACVLGGARMGGGRGYISGAIMGTLIIAIIKSLPGLSVSPNMGEALKGAVIIAAFLLQREKSRHTI